MTGKERDALLADCRSASDALAALEDRALTWAAERPLALEAYGREIRKHPEIADQMPDEWKYAVAAQVAMGGLLGGPAEAARFLAGQQSLSEHSRALVERAIARPWRYALFSTTADLGDDLWECVDQGDGKPFLLLSPSVTELMREGSRLFLSLLFSNGTCNQACGPVHYFRGYSPADFAYFASCLEPQRLESAGLSAVITRRPGPFLLLARWAEIPPVAHRGAALGVWYDERPADALPALASAHRFTIDASGPITRCLLESPDPKAPGFFSEAALYLDARKRRLMARAVTADRYGDLVTAVGPELGLPAEPRWRVSMNMLLAAKELLGREIPGWGYVVRFEPPGPTEEPPELKALNALLRDISRRENAGLGYSVEDLAALNGVPIEDARHALEIFREAQGRARVKQTPGGLEGFTPPPPDVRAGFRQRPASSTLFDLDSSSEVGEAFVQTAREAAARASASGRRRRLRALIVDGVVGPQELPRLLEDEFFRLFSAQRVQDVTLLSYTLYLLLRCGGRARPVRDYAVELLSTFGQILDEEGREDLVPTFQRFCTHVLEPLCLLSVEDVPPSPSPGDAGGAGAAPGRDSDAGPWIQATPVFSRWVRLGQVWEEPQG